MNPVLVPKSSSEVQLSKVGLILDKETKREANTMENKSTAAFRLIVDCRQLNKVILAPSRIALPTKQMWFIFKREITLFP